MILTSEQLTTLVGSANKTNSVVVFSSKTFISQPVLYFKQVVAALMTQIERWDLRVEYIFIHPHMEPYFLNFFVNEIEKSSTQTTLWGSKIITTQDIHPNNILGFCDYECNDYRNVALATIDVNLIERLNKIKAFW